MSTHYRTCPRCAETYDDCNEHSCDDLVEVRSLEARVTDAEERLVVLESQVRSLQSAAPKGIDHG